MPASDGVIGRDPGRLDGADFDQKTAENAEIKTKNTEIRSKTDNVDSPFHRLNCVISLRTKMIYDLQLIFWHEKKQKKKGVRPTILCSGRPERTLS
jgi:hypothetical protein